MGLTKAQIKKLETINQKLGALIDEIEQDEANDWLESGSSLQSAQCAIWDAIEQSKNGR
jgi:hypothetical protein